MTRRPDPLRGGGSGPAALLAILALVGPVIAPGAVRAREPLWCHTVGPGDTLWNIAERHGTSAVHLEDLNGLARPDVLPVGTVLRLPSLARLEEGGLELDGTPLPAHAGDLRRENRAADRQQLSRMRDLGMVRRFVGAGLLVRVPMQARAHRVEGVRASLRVARPWTKRFIEQLAHAFHALFDERLKVTSLTRTVRVQRELRHRNANAAPARGALRSTHLTGASVDVSKASLSAREVGWLRVVLRRLERRRLLHATEEFQQPHFHVMVYRRYLAYARGLPSALLIGGC
ncbi:MAG: DUF5715 family protein [Candidatus Rokuibacteriota bacterium]